MRCYNAIELIKTTKWEITIMSTEEIKEYIGTQLKALTSIASPTGFTKNATDYLMKQLEAMGYAPQLSNKGNVSVEISGEGAPLVLAAHVDTLGAMVRSIKDNGRLRPTTIGGHQWSTADGENCMVFTRDGRMYTGVVLNTEPSAHVADEKVETKGNAQPFFQWQSPPASYWKSLPQYRPSDSQPSANPPAASSGSEYLHNLPEVLLYTVHLLEYPLKS